MVWRFSAVWWSQQDIIPSTDGQADRQRHVWVIQTLKKNKSSCAFSRTANTFLFILNVFSFFNLRNEGRCFCWLLKCEALEQMRAMFWTKCSWGFPDLLRIVAPMGRERGPQDVTSISKKTQNNFLGIFENAWSLYQESTQVLLDFAVITGKYRGAWVSDAAVRLWMSVLLTCFLVRLFVWPDDRAEVGEDQCAQSAGSFLWSTVVVKRVLAEHKPVPTLLNPGSPHFPQQPTFK